MHLREALLCKAPFANIEAQKKLSETKANYFVDRYVNYSNDAPIQNQTNENTQPKIKRMKKHFVS